MSGAIDHVSTHAFACHDELLILDETNLFFALGVKVVFIFETSIC